MIEVGQHVVCIEDKWSNLHLQSKKYKLNFIIPSKGVVYTVKSMYISPVNNKAYIKLKEIINPKYPNGLEPGYNIACFRPLKKLSVNDFMTTKLLLEA